MFVSKEAVPVSVDGGTNTIYIRAKMDYGTQQRVQSAAASFTVGQAATIAASGNGGGDIPVSLGAYNIALLTHNILRWEGPAFAGVPCDAAHMEQLDPDEPLVDAVLREIQRRNLAPTATPAPGATGAAADPNGSGASGNTNAGAAA